MVSKAVNLLILVVNQKVWVPLQVTSYKVQVDCIPTTMWRQKLHTGNLDTGNKIFKSKVHEEGLLHHLTTKVIGKKPRERQDPFSIQCSE